MEDPKFPMFARVRHTVTGLQGKVTAFLIYANGCRQYEMTFLAKDEDEIKASWLDEISLELISSPSEEPAPGKRRPGGPSRGPARH